MLTVEDEHRILEAAPPHLRVAIVLLVQTGGRTYSEGLSLRWDQVDLVHGVIHPGSSVKTTDSAHYGRVKSEKAAARTSVTG